MMTELSLNILDIAENSVKAGAPLTEIKVMAKSDANLLEIIIRDNGCGMTKEQVEKALKSANLETLAVFEEMTMKKPGKRTQRLVYVTRRI